MLAFRQLETLDPALFQKTEPYPWINPHGLLTDAAFRTLVRDLPDVSRFERPPDQIRKHGQRPHTRFSLEWEPGMELAASWDQFIDELRGPEYRDWLAGMIGTRWFSMSFHWHYTPAGGEISPHCDARRKLGSHIFYLNTDDDWRAEWGGETLVLDDSGRFAVNSAPEFEDFDASYPARTLENYSLLFRRRANSWHGVRAVQCPEGYMRRVFIVVINEASPWGRFRRWIKRKPVVGY